MFIYLFVFFFRNQAIIYKGELTRKVEENHKEIEKMWEAFEKLKYRCIPILPDSSFN